MSEATWIVLALVIAGLGTAGVVAMLFAMIGLFIVPDPTTLEDDTPERERMG